jgi:hypothetical protein
MIDATQVEDGTHGLLVLIAEPSTQFVGTFSRPLDRNGLYFAFHIDKATGLNTFHASDWDFVPDPKPLPTAVGSVIRSSSSGGLFGRTRHGWLSLTWAPLSTPHYYDEAEMARVSPVVVFDAKDVS